MKRFFVGLLSIVTVVASLTYLISCLTPYISPIDFWPMAFLALGFPYLFIAILVIAFPWVFVRKKIAFCLLLLLLVGFQNLFSTFAISLSNSSKPYLKDSNTLRVLGWNVRSFDNPAIHADSPNSARRKMFDYIKNSNADILCLQEFTEYIGPAFTSNTKQLITLGYVHNYQTAEIVKTFGWGTAKTGSAIFSKIPLLDSGKTLLGDPSFPEHIAFIDVSFKNRRLRVFATHFKSLNLFANRNSSTGVLFHNDPYYVYEATKFEKLKVFAQDHVREAFIAKDQLNKSPYPLIYLADMNSVPTSYPYHVMSKGLTDAFIANGSGLGTTLDSLPKTLRIDFILVDKRFSIKSFQKHDVHLSDHFPQLADLEWH
ncbi:MAG: hypothetical protein JWQ40_2085 [Segetibacter sp.]|nr:hypothetical protein [Segetibacter sp.]